MVDIVYLHFIHMRALHLKIYCTRSRTVNPIRIKVSNNYSLGYHVSQHEDVSSNLA